MSGKQAVLLAGAFLLVYVAPLGVRPLFSPDETRYTEIPREMRASGDWIVPRFNGLRYFEKPVLGYWLNAASQELFGENRFAVRLPSALAAGLSFFSVLLLLGRRKEENPGLAGIAGALFLACPLVYILGTYLVLDGPFSAFFTLAMALFFRGSTAESPKEKRLFYAAFGVASGLAFLTKGFLGLVLPVLAIVPYMLGQRNARELFRFPWVPLLLAVAVALPWGLAIHFRDPDFWRYFIWTEHLQRFFDPLAGAQHPEPPWFFVPVLIGGALTLLFLLPAAAAGLRRSWREPLVSFCLLWFGLVFAFFSASKGKLGTYILPCFPPLAILITLGTHRYLESGKTRLFDVGAKIFGGLLLIALWGVAALQILPFPPDWQIYSHSEAGRWLLGSVAVLIWALATLLSTRPAPSIRKLTLCASAPVLALALFPCILPDRAREGNAPMALLERNAARIQPDSLLMTSSHLMGAVNWAYRRTDVRLARSAGEFAYGLDRAPDDPRLVLLEEIRDFAAPRAGTGRLTLFFSENGFAKVQPLLPEPLYLDRAQGFVFAQF